MTKFTFNEQLAAEGWDIDGGTLGGPGKECVYTLVGLNDKGREALDGVIVEADTGFREVGGAKLAGMIVIFPSEYDRIVGDLRAEGLKVR